MPKPMRPAKAARAEKRVHMPSTSMRNINVCSFTPRPAVCGGCRPWCGAAGDPDALFPGRGVQGVAEARLAHPDRRVRDAQRVRDLRVPVVLDGHADDGLGERGLFLEDVLEVAAEYLRTC